MHVHARSVDAVDRLRHEARVQAVLLGDLFQRVLKRGCAVCGAQRIRVLKVNLVLPWCNFMVRGFNLDAEQLQRIHHVLANLNPLITAEVKVTRAVMRRVGGLPLLVHLKQEELQLWAHVHFVAELRRALHLAAQHAARITGERFARWQHHVADHACGAGAALRWCPRQDAPGAHVGAQQLI